MQNGYDPVKAEQMGQAMFALLILGILWALSRVWCWQVERRMVIRPSDSFWRAYGRLLWRLSWRSLVLTAAMGVFLGLGRDAYDAGQKIGSVVGLYPLLFVVIAVTAWRATKRLFQNKIPIGTSTLSSVRPHRDDEEMGSRIRKYTNKLNGWQRAWVLIALIWAAVVLTGACLSLPETPKQ